MRTITTDLLYTQAVMSTLVAVFPGAPLNVAIRGGAVRVELLWDADDEDEQNARNALVQAELAVMASPDDWMEVGGWL